MNSATFSFFVNSFSEWREKAKLLLQRNIHPSDIEWREKAQTSFNFGNDLPLNHLPIKVSSPAISKQFLSLASDVACYRDAGRWALLYRCAWRILNENKRLLALSIDEDVARLKAMQKSIARDKHKMKAFVRFRKVSKETTVFKNKDVGAAEKVEVFMAWFEPEHHIVYATAPFFAKRFANMCWIIVTPEVCALWDTKELSFVEGEFQSFTLEDELETLWLEYYKNIFNPARLKLKAMQAEMPKKYWKNLPEAPLIHELKREANEKVRQMMESTPSLVEPKQMRSRYVLSLQTDLRKRQNNRD